MTELLKDTNWILILGGIILLLLAYISWDKKKRKELEEKLKVKTKKPIRKILILAGIVLVVFGILGVGKGFGIGNGNQFGFEEEGEKSAAQEANFNDTYTDLEQEQERSIENNNPELEKIYVRIRLRRIFLQEKIVDYAELEAFLKDNSFDGKEIVVQEDYADNECYESILQTLKDLKISYVVQHL